MKLPSGPANTSIHEVFLDSDHASISQKILTALESGSVMSWLSVSKVEVGSNIGELIVNITKEIISTLLD